MAITLKQIKDAMNAPPGSWEEINARIERDRQARREQYEKDKASAKPLWYDSDKNELVFRSGRREYVHTGQISITSEGPFELGYGEDGGICWPLRTGYGAIEDWQDLTADDMRELADLMIERWQKFRATLE